MNSTPQHQFRCLPLPSEVQRKTQRNTPPKKNDMFFARKSGRFYVPKMHLENANGCSVCAWLLTSGGLRLTLRLRRNVTLALRARAPTKRTHFDKQINLLTVRIHCSKAANSCKCLHARRKARRGAEPSPLNRSGSAAAFPRRVRVFRYTFA